MSISYIIINKTRKEYIKSLAIDTDNHETNKIKLWVNPLLNFLSLVPPDDDNNSYFGKWYNTEFYPVSEHSFDYDLAQGLCDAKVPDEKGGYKWVQTHKEESDQWENITERVTEEFIKYMKYWFLK